MIPALVAVGLLLAFAALLASPLGCRLRRRWFARLYDRLMAKYEVWGAPHRAALLSEVRGRVVEIGPGTGANLAHLTGDVEWIGIEPNAHMCDLLAERAAELDRVVSWRASLADLPDAHADAILSTLVLCSVPDPRAMLAEIRRVLRPGGRLVFIEHVGAPAGTRLRKLQRLMRPVWVALADGCCPDRDTEAAIRGAGFAEVHVERLEVPRDVVPPIVAPTVAGHAVR